MRICVMHNSGPGGAMRFVTEISSRLAVDDDVTVITWGDDPDPVIPGVIQRRISAPPIHLPAPLHPWGDLMRSVLGSRRAARFVDHERFDFVVLLACRWAQTPEALRVLTTPTVYFAQEGRRRSLEQDYLPAAVERRGAARLLWSIGRKCYDLVGGFMDRRAMRCATEILTNSGVTARALQLGYGVASSVVELGVDPLVFPVKSSGEERDAVIFVGALDPTKRPHLAVEAVSLLPVDDRPIVNAVCNREHAPYVETLVRQAHRLGVDLRIYRGIDDAELSRLYRESKALVAVARNEPFGLTVPEASASGTPVVAVAEGGYTVTVVPGINGALVDASAEALAGALGPILLGSAPFKAQALADWARNRWSWDRCTAEIREAGRRVMARNPGPARCAGLAASSVEGDQ